MRRPIAAALVFVVGLLIPFHAFSEKVGGSDITFKPTGASPVLFSHEVHVNVKGVKCSGCHYQVFQMAKGSYKMDMSKITKGQFCGTCHNGQRSFGVKEANNCGRCHK